MDTIECIKTRRSIRKFKEDKVPFTLVSEVVNAGRLAPSCGNIQPWKFIVVSDLDKREAISEACLHQSWMAKAPVIIVICSEPVKVEKYYGLRGEKLYNIQNCAAAAENMLIAAHALGLGACWVGAFDEEKIISILSIRDNARPQICIPVGYPDEQPPEHVKFPLEIVFYFNRWRGRIEDVPFYFEYFGPSIQRVFKGTAEAIEKKAKQAIEKGKEIAEKISKKVKEKKENFV